MENSKLNACQLEYLNAVLAEGDTAALVTALAAVARAQDVSCAFEAAGLGRLSLYKILSGSGHPDFGTVVELAAKLGYVFSINAIESSEAPQELAPWEADALLERGDDVERGNRVERGDHAAA
jgi:probable addiction module antidote protein